MTATKKSGEPPSDSPATERINPSTNLEQIDIKVNGANKDLVIERDYTSWQPKKSLPLPNNLNPKNTKN